MALIVGLGTRLGPTHNIHANSHYYMLVYPKKTHVHVSNNTALSYLYAINMGSLLWCANKLNAVVFEQSFLVKSMSQKPSIPRAFDSYLNTCTRALTLSQPSFNTSIRLMRIYIGLFILGVNIKYFTWAHKCAHGVQSPRVLFVT